MGRLQASASLENIADFAALPKKLYRAYFETRNFSYVMTLKLYETLSRNFVHSCGMVCRRNVRMALANCL